MGKRFVHHPDGLVYVLNADGTGYIDTVANFALDYGADVPALPEDAVGRFYEQDDRHVLLLRNKRERKASDVPWADGDAILAAIPALLTAQAARCAPPPPTLGQTFTRRCAEVDALLTQKLAVGYTHSDGFTYSASKDRQQDIIAIVTGINAGQGLPEGYATVPFKDKDGDPHPMNGAQFIGFATGHRDFVSARMRIGGQHKLTMKAIRNDTGKSVAQRIADINAYDITAGWP